MVWQSHEHSCRIMNKENLSKNPESAAAMRTPRARTHTHTGRAQRLENYLLLGEAFHQSFLAAAFLMAARTLLSSSRFLLARMWVPTLFLMNLSARLSFDTLSNSMARRS